MTKPTTILLTLCLLLSQSVAITFSNNNQTISSTNTPNTLEIANTPSITPTPHKSLSGLNRDLSRSTAITKDIQTNALDSSLSIDNRIFSTNGRGEIKNDFLELNDNIGQVGNALRYNIISQSIKNTLLDSNTTLSKEIQRYISSTNAINNLQQDTTLTHNLNNLTALNPQYLQDTLQQASDIASVGDGFGARVSLYNSVDTNLGYAYEPNQSMQYQSNQHSQTLQPPHSQNIIGFNTHTNNLNNSSSVINTIFHETINKPLHTSNEQSAINRGNTAEGIWKLKNFNYTKESKREQREIAKRLRQEQKAFIKETNNNIIAKISQIPQQDTPTQTIHPPQNNLTQIDSYLAQTKLTTQKWNEIYADSAILLQGNATYTQNTTNASNGNGVVDERTIFVHGTWSNPKKAFDSSFRDGVRYVLQDDKQEDFVWSGYNLNSHREKAARDLLLQINQPYKYKDGEELNIITHSHGGNIAKLLSQIYDYDNSPKLNIFNFGTPNRNDYVMSPKVEKFYNIYNKHDWLVQGSLGAIDSDFANQKNHKNEKVLTQEATESNAINVAVKRDSTIKIFTPNIPLVIYILLKGGYDNHSNFKDIQTLEVLKSYMENNK